ncbi:unnamed protein product, partial [Rotaria sp. Silwood1]
CNLESLQPKLAPIPIMEQTFRVDISDILPKDKKPKPNWKAMLSIKRRALPLVPAYSITTHKSQGQTLSKVVIDLKLPNDTDDIVAVTGGILVLASMLRRAKGMDLVALYRSLAKEVFPYQRYLPISEYSPERLERLLKTEFEDMTMSPQLQDPLTFVVTKRDTETKPFLIRNYDNPSSKHQGDVGWKCFEAARATTAAPTYFKPLQKNDHNYTDGGIGFNNPVELLYDEAFARLSSDLNKNTFAVNECPIAYIVSIGT